MEYQDVLEETPTLTAAPPAPRAARDWSGLADQLHLPTLLLLLVLGAVWMVGAAR